MEGLIAKQIMKQCGDVVSFSPPFNSATPRHSLRNPKEYTPGPGTYNLPTHDYQKTSKYHIRLQKQSPVKKQFQWIFGNSRSKGFLSCDNNKRIGPGAYQIKTINQSLHQAWGKSSRFANQTQKLSLPGPGSYQSQLFQHFQNNKKGSHQSVFKSKSPKISDLLFKKLDTPSKISNQNRLFNDQKEQIYQKQIPVKNDKSPVFASKVPRFLTQNNHSSLGPGSYQLFDLQGSKIRTQIPRLVRASQNLKDLSEKKQKNLRISSEVGPGSYNMSKYEMCRQLQYKGLSLPRQTRFNFKGKKKDVSFPIPGPGEYMRNKFTFIQNTEYNNNKLQSKKIKANSLRQVKESHRNLQNKHLIREGPGSYNLNIFDINFKIKKRRQHNERLKLMEIQIPAFDSKVSRPK